MAARQIAFAIAVAIATFGLASPQAPAVVIGPLVEVPALLPLVHVARRLQHRFPAVEPAREPLA